MGCSLIVKRNVNFRRINVSYKTIQCTGHAKSKINLAGPGLISFGAPVVLVYFLQYFLYISYTVTYFPWSPNVTLLLHPAGARAGPETAVLFGSYYFSILKVGISANIRHFKWYSIYI